MAADELIDAICETLMTNFGSGVRRYAGEVTQGLLEPCFLVLELEASQSRRIGPRYRRERSFDIQYFPAEAEGALALSAVAQRLFFALETPSSQSGERFRGTGLRAEIQDGVLHTFATYQYDLIDTVREPEMESAAVAATTKGG